MMRRYLVSYKSRPMVGPFGGVYLSKTHSSVVEVDGAAKAAAKAVRAANEKSVIKILAVRRLGKA